ncbi:hypothetical protein CEXT_567051 [Caerostris extrusa]|uniref:Uncharacterized protein n=1 Tax=Caerostris extrusa TaxID=172846 RepID=A0AAV4RJ60_CAEEX|nr:hypothetical protein CEXT_567051 [Caerostris extrusa]
MSNFDFHATFIPTFHTHIFQPWISSFCLKTKYAGLDEGIYYKRLEALSPSRHPLQPPPRATPCHHPRESCDRWKVSAIFPPHYFTLGRKVLSFKGENELIIYLRPRTVKVAVT